MRHAIVCSELEQETDCRDLAEFQERLRHFLRCSESVCQEAGVTALQYELLLYVAASGSNGMTIAGLAGRLHARYHATVALINRCAKLGLVERRIRINGRKIVAIHLSGAGERLFQQLVQSHQQELKQLQNAMPVPAKTRLCTSPVCWKGSD